MLISPPISPLAGPQHLQLCLTELRWRDAPVAVDDCAAHDSVVAGMVGLAVSLG